MEKLLRKNDRILIALESVFTGNIFLRSFQKKGYCQKELGVKILSPSKKDITFLDSDKLKEWLKIKNHQRLR